MPFKESLKREKKCASLLSHPIFRQTKVFLCQFGDSLSRGFPKVEYRKHFWNVTIKQTKPFCGALGHGQSWEGMAWGSCFLCQPDQPVLFTAGSPQSLSQVQLGDLPIEQFLLLTFPKSPLPLSYQPAPLCSLSLDICNLTKCQLETKGPIWANLCKQSTLSFSLTCMMVHFSPSQEF